MQQLLAASLRRARGSDSTAPAMSAAASSQLHGGAYAAGLGAFAAASPAAAAAPALVVPATTGLCTDDAPVDSSLPPAPLSTGSGGASGTPWVDISGVSSASGRSGGSNNSSRILSDASGGVAPEARGGSSASSSFTALDGDEGNEDDAAAAAAAAHDIMAKSMRMVGHAPSLLAGGSLGALHERANNGGAKTTFGEDDGGDEEEEDEER